MLWRLQRPILSLTWLLFSVPWSKCRKTESCRGCRCGLGDRDTLLLLSVTAWSVLAASLRSIYHYWKCSRETERDREFGDKRTSLISEFSCAFAAKMVCFVPDVAEDCCLLKSLPWQSRGSFCLFYFIRINSDLLISVFTSAWQINIYMNSDLRHLNVNDNYVKGNQECVNVLFFFFIFT